MPLLTREALHKANKRVASVATGTDNTGPAPKRAKKMYSSYSAEDCAGIGRYAAEHRPAKASRCLTVQESTARLLKKQYLAELHNQHHNVEIPEVRSLSTKLVAVCYYLEIL